VEILQLSQLEGSIMKSHIGFSLLAVAALSLSTIAFAAGPAAGRGAANGTSAQSRIHTPGTGLATGTPTQSRIGAGAKGTAPGTGAAAGSAVPGGPGRGVHTPGTGLTPVAPTP